MKKSNVLSLLTPVKALEIIRLAANENTETVIITTHATERMLERNVTRMQIFQVMGCRHTRFKEEPYQEPNGDWKCKITGSASGRVTDVVLAIKFPEPGSDIFVITVI